jgi:hypothetical protein
MTSSSYSRNRLLLWRDDQWWEDHDSTWRDDTRYGALLFGAIQLCTCEECESPMSELFINAITMVEMPF